MTETLTRAQIAAKINKELGFSQTESADLLDSVLSELSESLKSGATVKLSGFGNFVVRKKKQRVGRNPKTGKTAVISARNSITFSPSLMLKKRVNG